MSASLRVLLGLAVAAAMLPGGVARAADPPPDTYWIDLGPTDVRPAQSYVRRGINIRFFAAGFDTYKVVSYEGAWFETHDMRRVETTNHYDFVYPGGTIKFRDVYHSTYDPQTGLCSGMCGEIRDAAYVVDNAFWPPTRTAAPGQPVWWWWGSTGRIEGGYGNTAVHNVTAWKNGSFASPSQQSNTTFSTTYQGGTIFYRCTIHSTIDSGTGFCVGMCGVIVDRASAKPTATVETPRHNDVVVRALAPTVITGKATADSSVYFVDVRIWYAGRPQPNRIATCDGCRLGSITATWSLEIPANPGPYTIQPVVYDDLWNSNTGPQVSFVAI